MAGFDTSRTGNLSWPAMRKRLPFLAALTLAGGLLACSGVSSLDEEHEPLAPEEQAIVRSKAQAAFEEGAWATAWDEAVRAGAGRERLETIAIEAMAPLDPVKTPGAPDTATSMFDELRTKYGGLTPAARAQVSRRSAAYGAKNRWTEAVELELAAVDDPPSYAGAWAIYQAAPAWKVTAIRTRIDEAKEEFRRKNEEAAAGSGD